jgi:hypothetical protein
MGKTRRKLYGKKRRQRGGGSRWWILLGALAALKGARADDTSFGELVTNWWNSKTITESIRTSDLLAQEITRQFPKIELWSIDSTAAETSYEPPDETQKQEVDDVVEPYIESGNFPPRPGTVKDGVPGGKLFLRGPVTIVGEEIEEDEPPMWVIEKEIDGQRERYTIEKEYVIGGSKRRKTLRRKK